MKMYYLLKVSPFFRRPLTAATDSLLLIVVKLLSSTRLGAVTDTGHPWQVSLLGMFHASHSLVLDKPCTTVVQLKPRGRTGRVANPRSNSIIPFFLYAHASKGMWNPFISIPYIYITPC